MGRICIPLPGVGEYASKPLTLRELCESSADREIGGADFLLCIERWLLACPRQLTPKQRRDILDVVLG